MTTTTYNFSWGMPDPGGSPNTWGNILNSTTQAIDQKVFDVQQAGVPIGAITMFGGTAMPPNWTICAGQALDTTTYAKLFAVIGYIYGGSGTSFNVPNLVGKFPSGATDSNHPGATGGEATHALSWGETGPHYHNVPDPQHYHTISQGSHTHGDYGHGHGASASSSQTAHNHTLGGQAAAGVGAPPGSNWAFSGTGTTSTAQPGISTSVSIATGYANLAPSGTGVTNTDYALTRISTTDQQGSGTPHNNLPPFVTINFIMRYQ